MSKLLRLAGAPAVCDADADTDSDSADDDDAVTLLMVLIHDDVDVVDDADAATAAAAAAADDDEDEDDDDDGRRGGDEAEDQKLHDNHSKSEQTIGRCRRRADAGRDPCLQPRTTRMSISPAKSFLGQLKMLASETFTLEIAAQTLIKKTAMARRVYSLTARSEFCKGQFRYRFRNPNFSSPFSGSQGWGCLHALVPKPHP